MRKHGNSFGFDDLATSAGLVLDMDSVLGRRGRRQLRFRRFLRRGIRRKRQQLGQRSVRSAAEDDCHVGLRQRLQTGRRHETPARFENDKPPVFDGKRAVYAVFPVINQLAVVDRQLSG